MRKYGLILIALLCMIFLSGCMQSEQLENQAYVLIMGIDTAPNGVEVAVQILKASNSGSESGNSSGSDESYLLAKGSGASYSDAMQALQSIVQRQLDLSQTILVVASENLARSDQFMNVLTSIYESYIFDTSAWFAVCQGDAAEFVAAQKPVIGNRVSIAITSMLENYVDLGFVPDTTLADVYFAATSSFSDPVAILTSIRNNANADEDAQAKPEDTTPASSQSNTGGPNRPESISASGATETAYLGAAVFKGGRMVDTLTADEVLCLNLIHGGLHNFVITVDGHSAFLESSAAPRITVDVSGDVPVISAALSLSMEHLANLPKPEAVREILIEQLYALSEHCQRLQVDPFEFGHRAAWHFLTLEEWNKYDWKSRFSDAKFSYELSIRIVDA